MSGRNEKYIGLKKLLGSIVIIFGGATVLQTVGVVLGFIIGDFGFIESRGYYLFRFVLALISGVLIVILDGKLSNINLDGYDNTKDLMDEYHKAISSKVNKKYNKKYSELKSLLDINSISEDFYKQRFEYFEDKQLRDLDKTKPRTFSDKLFVKSPQYFKAFNDEPLKGFFCERIEKEPLSKKNRPKKNHSNTTAYFYKVTKTGKGIISTSAPLFQRTEIINIDGVETKVRVDEDEEVIFGFTAISSDTAAMMNLAIGDELPLEITDKPVTNKDGEVIPNMFWAH
tara:strand:+ start:484 stop:1338 length:855 start_codon:yes stop_codon:yes gene_type:complete